MFNWYNFLIYVLVTAFTPGPNNIMSMSNGIRLGFRKSMPFNFGVLAGFSVIAIACVTVFTLFSEVINRIQNGMLFLGAAYMLHLAYKIWKSDPEIEENHNSTGFLSGMLLQFVNVKIYIYAIVSMQVYVFPYYHDNLSALIGFAIILTVIAFISNMSWAAFGSMFRVLFSKYAKITNTIMALLLVYSALALFF